MAKEKPCNCKTSSNAKKLIESVNKINGYENIKTDGSSKKTRLNKTIYVFLKYFVYTILSIILIISAIPLLLFIIFNKKGIVVKLPKLDKYK